MKKFVAPARACAMLVMLALVLAASSFPQSTLQTVSAQTVGAEGTLSELAIEDATGTPCVLGQIDSNRGKTGFGWVNKLTPASYPATLRSVTIGFNRAGPIGREVKEGQLYRIVIYLDPEMNGPGNGQPPDATFFARARATEIGHTFNLVTPITITSGSFIVGAVDEFGIADLPAFYYSPGKSNPPGSESFLTFNGGATWQTLAGSIAPGSVCGPGSFFIRATVESPPVDAITITKIKDPQAVEPLGVIDLGAQGFVVSANLVSDNLTFIRKSDNSVQSVAVGDGPGGTPDGPFGMAVVGGANKLFVSLFGSNTIPTKEFPIDYSTVGQGRVAVVSSVPGAFNQVATINVGKGPMFPAMVPIGGGKIYVPCSGANRVDVINAATNAKIAEIPVGLNPSSCTVAITNAKVYVTNFGDGTISIIDPATDRNIGTIPAPKIQLPISIGPTPPVVPNPATAQNPWMGAISPTNGNLYVTYWSTSAGDVTPNGVIVEFDTCKSPANAFLRAIFDDTTRGTPAGSAGASGIPAPTAPLARDGATGLTPGAGGGGGGPFGIASYPLLQLPPTSRVATEPTLVFTNDGLGLIGAIDARIDQVVTAPAIKDASCPKPRGVALSLGPANPQQAGSPLRLTAYVACGQPDSSVLIVTIPVLARENIAGLPSVDTAEPGGKLRLTGTNLAGTKIEVIERGSLDCFTLLRDPKTKQGGRVLLQKGSLNDDRSLKNVFVTGGVAFLRLISRDGTVRLIYPPPAQGSPAQAPQ